LINSELNEAMYSDIYFIILPTVILSNPSKSPAVIWTDPVA
jgi:hypothetical protein